MDGEKKQRSFRKILSISMLICWILPIIIISYTAGMLLNRNYNRNLRQTTETEFYNALWQVELRLNAIIEDSKSITYEGVVEQAYRGYRAHPSRSDLLKRVGSYLDAKFSRNLHYRAVYLSFLDDTIGVLPHSFTPGISAAAELRRFNETVLPAAKNQIQEQNTGTSFMVLDGQIYMVSMLQYHEAKPYAVLISELEKAELMQSLYSVARNEVVQISIDGVDIPLNIEVDNTMEPSRIADISYTSQVDGHTLVCSGQIIGLDIWTTVPVLRWVVLTVAALVVPMLAVIISLFYWNINRPIAILIDATSRIHGGERGFQIKRKAPNSEFYQLYAGFNTMSSELDYQFKKLYEEQQALQQAKIKALQSQINPHFLNNTLEVINWEARLADNERVCTMIESLSTMLDAAIGRDGRSQVLLQEEMKYVEAYLHITKERLGDRLTITRDIAPETLTWPVPLLTLQPILENAVEYDLSRSGGELSLSAYVADGKLHLRVEHDGVVSEAGWKKICAGLHQDAAAKVDGRSVGIHNVVNRLALIYGKEAQIDIWENKPGRILAEIVIPPLAQTNEVKN